MTREQAEQRATALNQEHPERRTYRWLAHETRDGWHVTRISMPAGAQPDPLKATAEARPRPPMAPDPRPVWDHHGGGAF